MATLSESPGRGRYLISCTDGAKLASFIADASGNPELQLIDIIGPPRAPHTAVFDMAHGTAAKLESQFAARGDLKIEPDRPLSLFGPSP